MPQDIVPVAMSSTMNIFGKDQIQLTKV